MNLLTLAIVGVVGGLVTGISPCILPVLPVVFLAGGVQGARSPAVARGEARVTVGALAQPAFLAGARGGGASSPVVDEAPPGAVTAAGGLAAADARTGPHAPAAPTPRGSRPYLVIAGLVTSFTLVTLLGTLTLDALGLPEDLLRWAGIAVLALLGLTLLVPRLEAVVERPFARLAPGRAPGSGRGGFVLGLGLGAVYVPCAGPVLAAITVAGATGSVGLGTVVLTVSFAVGAACPLLLLALAGRRAAERIAVFRTQERMVRVVAGVLMIALAAALALNVTDAVQRALPGYTDKLQSKVAANGTVRRSLDLGGLVTSENAGLSRCDDDSPTLQDCGPAPALQGIDHWIGSPPLDLAQLRGKVVLIDFWAYSCINCQRSVPHVEAWSEAYGAAGLVVIGVHTPEYAFERETRNVAEGARRLGITYPVAQDNGYATWTAYRNRYWPASYLVDAHGTVRQVSQGEGGYGTTEHLIRELLQQADTGVRLPATTDVADTTPHSSTTPETFLGIGRHQNVAGAYHDGAGTYALSADQPADTVALGGAWTTDQQGATAGAGAQARLRYHGRVVQAVLGGSGTVHATVRDTAGAVVSTRTLAVSGAPRSYAVVDAGGPTAGTVDLAAGAGVELFSFTFG